MCSSPGEAEPIQVKSALLDRENWTGYVPNVDTARGVRFCGISLFCQMCQGYLAILLLTGERCLHREQPTPVGEAGLPKMRCRNGILFSSHTARHGYQTRRTRNFVEGLATTTPAVPSYSPSGRAFYGQSWKGPVLFIQRIRRTL